MTSMPTTPGVSYTNAAVGAEFAELWSALASQYTVERELGRGGMGAVFQARDLRLDRFVAIKVLPPQLASDSDLRELFLREARTAARLSHPNIVPVFRADELAGHPFFAMPFIEGENLAERVSVQGPLPPADAVRWLREVAWALAYAHARGVIHRDVKPENIMIERGSNRAIVTDFGIARVEFAPVLAQDALIVGTASYMSPEQIRGEGLDGRSDLYSLGVVGFVLLSGKLPFSAANITELLDAHTRRPAPPLASVVPTVPVTIASVIDRCLAKDRESRFPTGESLADALEKALRLSESALGRTGEYAIAALSPRDASLVWQRAIALQVAALQDSSTAFSEHKAGGHLAARELEATAVAAGIQPRFVRRALDELAASRSAPPSVTA